MGIDIHGQSVTKAAQKAVKDAVSKSCLCGLEEILGYSFKEMNEKVVLKITVAVTRPEDVDTKELEQLLPVGEKEFTVVKGGLTISGLNISEFGDMDDSIEASIVCIEVCIKE
ncbi:conserved hypothetical protein [Dethiosulfatibacter aminovorans DSM 17477]|uniref:Uncharacterized protein n=1 Tax=Dethiosulfatibacter aminovorans DSM 17477 TaxID=1121476 RepID=A0A1M6F1J6_9FIRM|nr:conserved hypothetical protein [Dethiosulfatibacter aminovorans DSM 17477]